MATRPFGAVGQESSVLTFGAIALDFLDQNGADELAVEVLGRGVDHVDVIESFESTDEDEQADVVDDSGRKSRRSPQGLG